MLKIPKNWIAVLGVSLSLPSTILAIGWFSMKLVEWGYLTRFWGAALFILVITNSLVLLVWHGFNKKN